jgi:hypothetical protein
VLAAAISAVTCQQLLQEGAAPLLHFAWPVPVPCTQQRNMRFTTAPDTNTCCCCATCRRYQNAYNAYAGTVPLDDDMAAPPGLKEGGTAAAQGQAKAAKKPGFLARMFACGSANALHEC